MFQHSNTRHCHWVDEIDQGHLKTKSDQFQRYSLDIGFETIFPF